MAVLAKRLQVKDEFAIYALCVSSVELPIGAQRCRAESLSNLVELPVLQGVSFIFFCHTSLGKFRFSSAFGTLTRTTFPSPEKS